jgi:hypothetical protein
LGQIRSKQRERRREGVGQQKWEAEDASNLSRGELCDDGEPRCSVVLAPDVHNVRIGTREQLLLISSGRKGAKGETTEKQNTKHL